MQWEKKDDDGKVGHCTLSSLEEAYLEEEVRIPDPLKDYFHSIAVDRIKEPIMNRPESIVIPEPEIITKIRDEIDSRGCFTVDISKLVDVLFKLGIIVPKEPW